MKVEEIIEVLQTMAFGMSYSSTEKQALYSAIDILEKMEALDD